MRRNLAAALPQAKVQTAAKQDRYTLDGLKGFISIIKGVLLGFGGVALLVGAFTIFNSLSIMVAQRSREFGLLRLAGASRRQVLRTVVAEALAMGAAASAVGLAAGFGLAKGINALFKALGLDLPQTGTVFASRTIIVSLLVGMLVTLVAGLVPAWRATRVAPVEALRDASGASRRLRLPARIVRAVVGALGRPVQATGGPAAMLARRNAMRAPGRTAITASALTIGVALVAALTIIAAGLKDSTKGSLDKRVSATHVLAGDDGWSPVDGDAARKAAAVPRRAHRVDHPPGRRAGLREDRGHQLRRPGDDRQGPRLQVEARLARHARRAGRRRRDPRRRVGQEAPPRPSAGASRSSPRPTSA